MWTVFESEDVQTTARRLRNVDTDELNFKALCDDLGDWPCKRKQRNTMVSKDCMQVHAQATFECNCAH